MGTIFYDRSHSAVFDFRFQQRQATVITAGIAPRLSDLRLPAGKLTPILRA